MTENAFRELLNNAPLPSYEVLPLVHDTTYTAFTEIVSSGNIELCHCKVFNMNLLYFYYGRKSYRVSEKIKKYSQGLLPTSLIVKTDFVKSMVHAIYPFDTGAYEQGLFDRYFTKKNNFEEFCLGSEITKARQFVEMFYSSNKDYMLSKTKNINNNTHLIVDEYINLINAKQDSKFDDRCSTVEIQVFHKIPIFEALEAIVIPEKYQGSNYVKQMVQKGIEILTYDIADYLKPSEYNIAIRQKVMDYYRRRNYI